MKSTCYDLRNVRQPSHKHAIRWSYAIYTLIGRLKAKFVVFAKMFDVAHDFPIYIPLVICQEKVSNFWNLQYQTDIERLHRILTTYHLRTPLSTNFQQNLYCLSINSTPKAILHAWIFCHEWVKYSFTSHYLNVKSTGYKQKQIQIWYRYLYLWIRKCGPYRTQAKHPAQTQHGKHDKRASHSRAMYNCEQTNECTGSSHNHLHTFINQFSK